MKWRSSFLQYSGILFFDVRGQNDDFGGTLGTLTQ